MGFEVDILHRLAFHWNHALREALERHGAPAWLTENLQGFIFPLEFAVLVLAVAAAAAQVERHWQRRRTAGASIWLLGLVQVAAGLYALRLLYWVYLHPAKELQTVTGRWDYVVAAILGGLAMRRLPFAVRPWILAIVSVLLIHYYVGPVPSRVVFMASVVGFAATRWTVTNQPGVRVVVHAALITSVAVWFWWFRGVDGIGALRGWSLYSFVLFRHISFVVEHARGVPSTFGGYLCYLLFFPNCIGAMEVYDEFWSRNLARETAPQFRRAALWVVAGNALVWLTIHISADENQVVGSTGFLSLWGNALLHFFRAALGSLGIWAIVEGGALFLGVQLRPNFRYVLTATTPSEFWRAWRATMTYWLIRYVYIPLGGNRRHQMANIFAVFVVSTAWHCVGVLFLLPSTWTAGELMAVGLWGGLNFAGVATHALVRQQRPAGRFPQPWGGVVLAGKWMLTMLFGTLTTLLLGLSLAKGSYLGHVVRAMTGLEGW